MGELTWRPFISTRGMKNLYQNDSHEAPVDDRVQAVLLPPPLELLPLLRVALVLLFVQNLLEKGQDPD